VNMYCDVEAVRAVGSTINTVNGRPQRARLTSAPTVERDLQKRPSAQRFPGFADTEEVTGSNPVAPTPYLSWSERRRSPIGGALVVPGRGWGHAGATAPSPGQPDDGACGYRLGTAVERVQAVAECGVDLGYRWP
jgi:hypothetical protein